MKNSLARLGFPHFLIRAPGGGECWNAASRNEKGLVVPPFRKFPTPMGHVCGVHVPISTFLADVEQTQRDSSGIDESSQSRMSDRWSVAQHNGNQNGARPGVF
jgi:hypothetical protein